MMADCSPLNDFGQKRGCSGLLMTSSEGLSGTVQVHSELNNNNSNNNNSMSLNEKNPSNNTQMLEEHEPNGHGHLSSKAKEQRHPKCRPRKTATTTTTTILDLDDASTSEEGDCRNTLRNNGHNDNVFGGVDDSDRQPSDDCDSFGGPEVNRIQPLAELLEGKDKRKFLKFRDRVVVRLKRIWHDLPTPQTDANLLKNGVVKNTKRMRFETRTIELSDDDDD